MVKCLPKFEYFYCVLEKTPLFLKLENQKLQTMLVVVVVDSNRQFYTANEHCVLYCI